ncbi:MAG: SDR family NAD(P)-dependent oxidoreductase [Burkholderiaceae bacterium]|nr:SDR family NAD(P)-dependent oxidoreductase [Burkholderiaceae bacterium]
MEFSNRTVVVTGAAGNLGRAVAAAFAARGANLALLDRTEELLRRAYAGEDARRQLLAVDLLDAAATDRALAAAAARFGRIDVLANIAGGFRMGEAVHETSAATWDFLIDINVRTLLNAVRAAVPRMLAAGGGRIVNVGAASALKGAAQMGAYVAAKSAVIRLTESMALELREKNVNVNCVLPSIIDTPENRAAMPDADPRRWVAPEALADVIVFLASDAARAIHGAAVPVVGLS